MPSLVPYFPTLGPRAGWKFQSRRELPFPLNSDRAAGYYMGRAAIYHGARALGLKPGDEILFPAYHSGTESAPLLHLGGRLKLYGVASDLAIDLDEIEAKIGPATRALYAIHFIGFPAPIVELRELADRHGLVLIEDCALGFLSRAHGRPLGSWGDMSIFCVYKTLPLPAGGFLAINRDDVGLPTPPPATGLYSEINLTIKHVLNYIDLHGGAVGTSLSGLVQRFASKVVTSTPARVVTPEAMTFDAAWLQWGLGSITRRLLPYFDYASIAARRRNNYQWLAGQLRDSGVRMLRQQLPDETVPLFFPIVVPDKFDTVARLRRDRVMAVPFWGKHHAHVPRGEFPETEFLVDHVVEIPIYQDLSPALMRRIADAVIRHARPMPPTIARRAGKAPATESVLAGAAC